MHHTRSAFLVSMALALGGCGAGGGGGVAPEDGGSGSPTGADGGRVDASSERQRQDASHRQSDATPSADAPGPDEGDAGQGDASAQPPSTGTTTSATFTPSGINTTAIVPNPDRGIALWSANDMIVDSASEASDVASAYAAGARLVYCTIDLAPYIGTTIPASALATIQNSFDAVRAGGVKCMMLIAYGVYSGSDPGESLTDITTHAGQLAATLHANADVIPYAKMGFVGEYGQWFNSTQTGAGALTCGNNDGTGPGPCPNADVTANQLTVRDAILAAYDPATMLGFTNASIPYGWASGVPVSQTTAFSGTPLARVGIEDDCPLTGSGTPLVSQGDTGVFDYDNYNSATTTQLISFTESTSRWNAFFGEFSDSCTPYVTDCTDSLNYLTALHAASFKMIGYNTSQSGGAGPWGSAWQSGGCLYAIMNSFGSSLELDGVSHQSTAAPGESITVDVKLRNIGYSIVFTARKVVAQACLVASPNTCYGAPATPDLRQLPPQATESSTVTATINIPPGAAPGAYEIRLSVPDVWATTQARAFMMRFANTDSGAQAWNDASGYWVTGTTLTVQ